MREEAQLRVSVQERIRLSEGYKTIHFGLKLNHERNVAIVHPLMFLLRRVAYATTIIFMAQHAVLGVISVMLCTLFMLAYSLSEHQWREPLINNQHIVDEIAIYILCVFALLFNNYLDPDMRYELGWLFIGICIAFTIFNFVVIVYHSARIWNLFIGRTILLYKFKRAEKSPAKHSVTIKDENKTPKENADNDHRKISEVQNSPLVMTEKAYFQPESVMKGSECTNNIDLVQRTQSQRDL